LLQERKDQGGATWGSEKLGDTESQGSTNDPLPSQDLLRNNGKPITDIIFLKETSGFALYLGFVSICD
jgi:hypothetical protein